MDENFFFYLSCSSFYDRDVFINIFQMFFNKCQNINGFYFDNVEEFETVLREENTIQNEMINMLDSNGFDFRIKDHVDNSGIYNFVLNFFNRKSEELSEENFYEMMINLHNSVREVSGRTNAGTIGILMSTNYYTRFRMRDNFLQH